MIIDAHQDLAYDAWALGRDFFLSAYTKRAREASVAPQGADICTLGWPELQTGDVGLVFGSIFVETARSAHLRPGFAYNTPDEARSQALMQLAYYHRLASDPRIILVKTKADLDRLNKERARRPTLGLLVELEGAEAILAPGEVGEWQAQGVRQIGLAWAYANRYCGGNRQPGPLTADGKALLRAMERAGLILDVSHLAEESFWPALDVFGGPVVASHSNCRALVPGERQLSDDMIRALVACGGVIGIVFYNRFLKPGWTPEQGKDAVTLSDVVAHIDHICQLAGSANHVGIGSDLDGGFGAEATPAEIDTVADLPRLAAALAAAGYDSAARDNIMGNNWLHLLQQTLPAEETT